MSNTITVEVVADVKRMADGMDKASKELEKLHGVAASGSGVLKGALGAEIITEGARAIASGIGDAISAVKEQNALSAQTDAALKSTGAANWVTADAIRDHADALEAKSMMDAEVIQSGQNMLLTFTNVQDRVGAGNDIFSQATQIMVDMATATGGDAKGAALQLGKALNDPIAGISALSRVGVTFTDQQKSQIETMVKAGDTAGAQKVILAQLNKEFGGSGEAAAKADGGMKRLKDILDGVMESGVRLLLPGIQTMTTWLSENLPTALDTASGWLSTAGEYLKPFADGITMVGDWMAANPETMTAFAITLGVLAGALGVVAVATGIWNAILAVNPVVLVVLGIAALVAAIVWVTTHIDQIGKFMSDTWNKAWSKTKEFFTALGNTISDGINSAVEWFKSLPGKIMTALGDLDNLLVNAGKAIIDGFFKGLKDMWDNVTGWFKGIGDWIAANKGPLDYDARLLTPHGRAIMQGLMRGLKAEQAALGDTLDDITGQIVGISPELNPRLSANIMAAANEPASIIEINLRVDPTTDREDLGRKLVEVIDSYAATRGRRLAWV